MELLGAVFLLLGIVLGGILMIGLLSAYSAISWGCVLLLFWGWFVLPVFPTLPDITIYQAVGLYMFISLFKNHSTTSYNKKFNEKYKDTKTTWVLTFIFPWVVLLIGYITHLFI